MSYLLAYNPYNTNLFMRTRSIDPAAQDFIDAAGITGDVQQQAINNLVKGLKSDGLWSKMKAIYPFVTDNRNLASYTEDFSNGYWTGPLTISTDSTTAPNGTNTADALIEGNKSNTYYQSNFSSLGLSNSNYTLTVYVKKGTRDWVQLSMNNGTTNLFSWFNVNTGSVGTVQVGASASITNSGNGWYRCSMTCAMSISGNIIGFGPAISDGVSTYTGNSSIGIYAWGAQLELGSTATTYQPIATTQQAYIANQFKYNLKDPRDLDAAFRLVFNGGWTHSSTGATPNGVNAWGDTKLPNNTMSQNSMTMCTYLRTDTMITKGDLGVWNGGFGSIIYSRNGLGDYRAINNSTSANVVDLPVANSLGFFLNKRTSSTQIVLQKNSTQTTFSSNSENLLTSNFIIAKTGDFAGEFSDRQTAFVGIGDGLTDTEAANLYTIVQNFQTSLNRQV